MKPIPPDIENTILELSVLYSEYAEGSIPLSLRALVEKGEYDYQAIPEPSLKLFNKYYFLRNALKSLLSIRAAIPDGLKVGAVSDIGCGSGAASIALLGSRELKLTSNGKVRLIDQSSDQIKDALKNYERISFSNPLLVLNGYVSDLSGENTLEPMEPETKELRIASYSFCEMVASGTSPQKLRSLLGGHFLLIDYFTVISNVFSSIIEESDHATASRQVYSLSDKLTSLIGQPSLKVNCLYAR